MGLQSSPSRDRNRPSTLLMAVFLFLAEEDTSSCSKDHIHDACKSLFFLFTFVTKLFVWIDRMLNHCFMFVKRPGQP